MLFYVLFACFLAMTTTEAQTVSPTVHQEATTQQHPETPDITDQVPSDAIDPVMPAALEAAPTIIAPTTTFFGDKTSIPQAEATKENIKAGSPSQSTLIQTNGSTVSANKEMPMSTAQNGEIVSTTVSSMQATTANTILTLIQTGKSRTPTESAVMTSLNPTFKFVGSIQTSNSQTQTESQVTTNLNPTFKFVGSIQTSNSQTQTESAVMTDRPLSLTTQVVPKVKLSAITTSTSEKFTTKLEKTTRFVRQSTKATTKLAKTSKALVTPLSNDDRENSVKHGKIIAGIIGGALIAMFIGFLVILYKKHTLKKHQIATTDWAGPTPFLETGGDSNGHVTLRSASRISLTGFLPQRLSKRLTLLAESGEEMQDMQDMTIPTTFVGKEEQKVEKNGTKADTISKSDKEAVANKSDIPTKVENVVVVDEMNRNGEIKNKEGDNGQAKTEKGENGAENAPTQPPAAENPPKESNN